ncbi:MAG: hypothetical protein AB7K24_23505 [Gemmataceae bacterium]
MRPALLLVSALLLLLPACARKEPPPQTHTAKGKVLLSDGKPLARATVRFHSITDPNLIVTGITGADGTFILETVHAKAKVPGAVEGEYRVSILPPMQDQETATGPMLEPVDLQETVRVHPGNDNDFTLTYPAPG